MIACASQRLGTLGAVCVALLYGMTVCSAQEPNLLKNAAFRTDPDANGRPRHWEGEPKLMQLVKSPYVQGRKAIRLERGGRLSQTVPAEAGRSYVVTVQADTIFYEEKGQFRYRSRAFAELAFLPSGEKARTEMVSPFGDCAELVPYAIGGTAPDGTQCVRVSIVTGAAPCVIGEARLVAYENSTEHFRLKDLHIDTAIVRDGRVAARIVVPESGVHDGSARKIAEKIRELTGVELPVVKDTGSDLCRGQRLTSSLIVFGNRNTNRVVGDLYDLYYCIIDLRYPGKGGSVVRSLHDPFGDGHNVIFVGASDAGGMEKATDAFVRVLDSAEASAGNLTVGYLADIEPGSDVAIPETMGFNDLRNVKPWDATNRTGGYGWTVITKAMAYYYLTGYEHYAKEFMRLAFPKDEQTFRDLKSCGQDFRGAVRKTEPLVNVYHYRAHLPIVYWDLIEESPFFSDEDRTKITGQFMKQVRKFVEDKNMGTGFATAMPQMPTRSFEQALFSGGNVINAGEDLLVGVTEYLKAADVINSLAKIVIATSNLDTQSRASTVRREALKKAVDMSARLAAPRGPAVGPPEERLLDRLARLLREELDQTR